MDALDRQLVADYGLDNRRNQYAPDDYMQAVMGPANHRDFVRESVFRNPFVGTSVAMMAPVYTGGKALGLINARSPASLDEIFAAYDGLLEGWNDWWNR